MKGRKRDASVVRGESPSASLSRRAFLKGTGTIAAGSTLVQEAAARARDEEGAVLDGTVEVAFLLNGERTKVRVEPRTTLLSALRSHLEVPHTGAKEVCDHGSCGACTVLLDDEPVCACMTLAVLVEGRAVRTVEGLAQDGELSAVQRAFVAEDATMCGFCTPGFVMSVTACLERNPHASEQEVREACRGNLCRCGTYPHVFRAAQRAGAELSAKKEAKR